MINIALGMKNLAKPLMHHTPTACCGKGKVYRDGPSCCCFYHDCRKVCCGEEIKGLTDRKNREWDLSTLPQTTQINNPSCCGEGCCDVYCISPFLCYGCCSDYTHTKETYFTRFPLFGSEKRSPVAIIEKYYPAWYRCKGCFCNCKRFLKGLKKQFRCSDKWEIPNLLFLLTAGCCFGACCLDHHGHIIPCAGVATCFADRCPCCICRDPFEEPGEDFEIPYGPGRCCEGCLSSCRQLSRNEYSSGQYSTCSNFPICCVITLLTAKYGFGIPIPTPGLP